MEVENNLYADVHGDGQGQPSHAPPHAPPTYTATAQQQQPGTWNPSQEYGQHGPYPTAGTPYYAPPSGAGYGDGYGVQSQQPQHVTVFGNNPSLPREQPVQTFMGAFAYSCIVFLCCNMLFGLVGYILAGQYFSAVGFFLFFTCYFNYRRSPKAMRI